MKRLCISLGYGCLMALVACSEQADMPQEIRPIMLQASIGEVENSSRVAANPFRGNVPTSEQPLDAAVWFSLTPNKYEHGNSEQLPCHTTINFTDDTPQPAKYNNIGLVYPTPGSDNVEIPVYCVGFHPSTGWSTTDGTSASHDIDGVQDLMFAPKITGTWNTHFSGQVYQHLLTWLKINVCATNMEAADTWGKITEITITSRKTVNVPLNGDPQTYGGDIQEIVVFQAGNEAGDPKPIPMKIAMQEVGSVLCSPPVETKLLDTGGSENKYVVSITTDKLGKKTLDVALPNDQAAGKLFVLAFYFHPFDVVESSCTLETWDAVNEDLYPDTSTQSN